MRKIIIFFKNDFNVVREELSYLRGKQVSKRCTLIWYITLIIILSPIMPFLIVWSLIYQKMIHEKLDKMLRKTEV